MSDEEGKLKKVRYLEYGQTICMLLTLLAFADIYSRIGDVEENCRLLEDRMILTRIRRSTPTQTLLNTSENDLFKHSLLEIKVSE